MWLPERLEVERLAEQFATFGGPPTDLLAIAGAVGICNILYRDIDSAALLQVGPVKGTWGVIIRSLDSQVRRRFSLAHEIAHVALGIVGDESRYMGQAAARETRSPAERMCDYYAAALLMPNRLVNEAAGENPDVDELARVFEVSRQSMRIRLEHVGFHALAQTS